MRSKDWLLFLGILLIGVIIHEVGSIKKPFWLDYGLGRYSGNSIKYTEKKDYAVKETVYIEIMDNIGSVSVIGATRGGLELAWDKLLYETDRKNADKIAQQIKLNVEKTEDIVKISTNVTQVEEQYGVAIKNAFTLRVPPGSSISIKNKMGEVIVTNIKGKVSVKNSYGDTNLHNIHGETSIRQVFGNVQLHSITGRLSLESEYSNIKADFLKGSSFFDLKYTKVQMENIEADAEINMEYGFLKGASFTHQLDITARHVGIELRDIKGKVFLESDFSNIKIQDGQRDIAIEARHSPLFLENIQGKVYVEANQKEVKLQNISGWCKIIANHAVVEARQIHSGIYVKNAFEDIVLEDISGKALIENHHSDIKIKMNYFNNSRYQVNTSYGNVELILPEQNNFSMEGISYRGDIKNNYSDSYLFMKREGDYYKVRAKNNNENNNSISIKSYYGDIVINKRSKTVAWMIMKATTFKEDFQDKVSRSEAYIRDELLSRAIEFIYYAGQKYFRD
ncbi:MAG: hypothetical protein A2Y62_22285 [Candidatus Fischerbacteria bacterium RBG_13_37_8]|uniref:DUF4097 domain-containing protein n=1 Tax=Candidatus Fischerbacteria bacterium RBG_13_37_8 TaxID=1817863 RepID=A0A1F5VJE6_9BACT|nr:MAG: hypothetical protein A2Y62_22285 [Candidatus Fischerbacteria bacterium RBG_13_37_8]